MLAAVLVVLTGCSSGTKDNDAHNGDEEGYVASDHQLTRIKPKDRKQAPDIKGPSLTGSDTIKIRDYDDKVLVINVWGSWCAPCREEAPDLRKASKETDGKARFIGIDSRDSGKSAPRSFIRSFKISYPSIYDPDGRQVVKFTKVPPSAIPATLVLDRHGRVAARVLGTVTRSTLVDLIHDVADGK